MTKRNADLEMRLRGLPRPVLPEGLKRRVMAEARLAPRPSWGDRAWYSGRWRLAAVAMLLAILAVDRWSAWTFRVDGPPQNRAAIENAGEVAAVGAEVGMPVDTMGWLAARVEFAHLTARESLGQAETELR